MASLRTINLYDTRRREVTPIVPRKENALDLFVCGPTVYDDTHIGNARTDVTFDFFTKYLRLLGYQVNYLQNITDIDDKIIQRAEQQGQTAEQLARDYEVKYGAILESLGVDSVSEHAKATAYIPHIIDQISRLLDKGFAYQTTDGIYFEITRFANYGKLAGRTALSAEDGVSRIDDSTEKHNKGDFALWKKKSSDREPAWSSPWGEGRPGWHIEDTAITESFFGPQYDIHGSGIDLIFPHHEAEIAQMEAISGLQPLVQHWMHVGFLTVNGTKMSKSKGNFLTTKDVLARHKKEDLRMAFFLAHYRSPFEYNEEVLVQARESRLRIREFLLRVHTDPLFSKQGPVTPTANVADNLINEALLNDFNTPLAISHVFNLIRDSYKEAAEGSAVDRNTIERIYANLDKVAGIGIHPETLYLAISNIPAAVHAKAQERDKARSEKNWDLADTIRKEIESQGYSVRDTDTKSLLSYIILPN